MSELIHRHTFDKFTLNSFKSVKIVRFFDPGFPVQIEAGNLRRCICGQHAFKRGGNFHPVVNRPPYSRGNMPVVLEDQIFNEDSRLAKSNS